MAWVAWLKNTLSIYADRRALILLALGFSAGLPLLLVFGTLSIRLREAGVSRTEIGFFSWVAFAYSLKWIWAPFVDRLKLPLLHQWLGRRRSWMILSQVVIAIILAFMAWLDPVGQLYWLALCAALLAFASATQDIVIDAYRIESAEQSYQGALAATYLTGYRLAMITVGAGALAIAAWMGNDQGYDPRGWFWAYISMAALMSVGIFTALLIPEPSIPPQTAQRVPQQPLNYAHSLALWFQTAFLQPFSDFFNRYGWDAILILALISCYRLSDIVLGVMANSFYIDIGFSKSQIATITKVYGVIMTLIGAGVGGVLIAKQPTWRVLLYGAIGTAITNLLFIALNHIGSDPFWLTLVISADNFTAGVATSAFIAYLSSLTNISYSATQYALFSSVMLLFPKFVAGFSGVVVDQADYNVFFVFSASLGIPVIFLILWIGRRSHLHENDSSVNPSLKHNQSLS